MKDGEGWGGGGVVLCVFQQYVDKDESRMAQGGDKSGFSPLSSSHPSGT